MLKRYQACMVLAGVGDAIGYKYGAWEFCPNGALIHKEVAAMGGVENIKVALPMFNVSDDTVMLLATSEALLKASGQNDMDKLLPELASSYVECMSDMEDRAPGMTTQTSIYLLRSGQTVGHCVPFNENALGCGAAMRAMCIGLRYPMPENIDDLVQVSIEAGRITHHHPTAYLGSLATALFTSYAIQDKPIREWGAGLMSTLPVAKEYVKSAGKFVTENLNAWDFFESEWKKYLEFREISDGQSEPKFTTNDDLVEQRDLLWRSWSFGTAGATGHDAPMIAYDALMQAGSSWTDLCMRGMFHGGDSDSTGVIDGAWFGAMYGLQGVPEKHYEDLEYVNRLKTQGAELFKMTKFAA